MYLIMFR